MDGKQNNKILLERIAELELQISSLEKDLMHDSLTKLKTRGFFMEKSKIYLDMINNMNLDKRKDWFGPKNISFLFMDIDHFKKVNDTYGHDIGDIVLKRVAEAIEKNVRMNDTVARWGGEEIIVSLLGTDLDDAKIKAENIRKKVEKLQFAEVPELKITISIGVASSENSPDFDVLMKKADKALYESKNSGRNKVTIYSKD
jgi:diguanylate cyclase (GGDEF)-like protein